MRCTFVKRERALGKEEDGLMARRIRSRVKRDHTKADTAVWKEESRLDKHLLRGAGKLTKRKWPNGAFVLVFVPLLVGGVLPARIRLEIGGAEFMHLLADAAGHGGVSGA